MIVGLFFWQLILQLNIAALHIFSLFLDFSSKSTVPKTIKKESPDEGHTDDPVK